ncbi:hypothetical protein [Shinella zoogloeoides]|uniref:hypothetical protein n=1 Tax=Shinella zoogloeoides TaxID=352475 RepID=UPI001F56F94C|nr:hypothetical protein [Shinella zoogloeoides]
MSGAADKAPGLKPIEAARILSEFFDEPVDAVRQKARVLRDAGIIRKETAGRGAGNLSDLEIAQLVVAVGTGCRACESASVVKFHGHEIACLADALDDGNARTFVFKRPLRGRVVTVEIGAAIIPLLRSALRRKAEGRTNA